MMTDIQRIQPGVNVYGRDEDKIGEVAEVGTNYVLVQKGWLFTSDVYVPFSAISTVAQDRIVLNVTKDELGQFDWSAPPSATFTGTSSAAFGTGATTDTRSTPVDTTYSDTGYPATGTTATTRTAAYDATVARGTTLNAGDETAVPIVEEQLRVGIREVERGGVRVTTRVEETPVEEQVTLREERVHVERHPVDRPVADAELTDLLQEGTVEMRMRGEEVVADKQARVVEEVVVRKDVEERTETVRETVRRTAVDVQEVGGTTRTTDATTDVDSSTGSTTGRDRTLTDRIEGATGLDIDRDDVAGRAPRADDVAGRSPRI